MEKINELNNTLTVTIGGRMMEDPMKEKLQEVILKVNEIVDWCNNLDSYLKHKEH